MLDLTVLYAIAFKAAPAVHLYLSAMVYHAEHVCAVRLGKTGRPLDVA